MRAVCADGDRSTRTNLHLLATPLPDLLTTWEMKNLPFVSSQNLVALDFFLLNKLALTEYGIVVRGLHSCIMILLGIS